MKSHLYSVMKFAIGWPLSLLALFFIIKILSTQVSTLVANLHTIEPALLSFGIFSFVIFYFLRSYLWCRILKQYDHDIPFRESGYLWAMSELKRYIPGNVWSFLGRAVLFKEKGVTKKDIGKGLIIEAAIFVLGCAVISLLSLPFLLPTQYAGYGSFIEFLVIVTVILYCQNRKISSLFSGKLRNLIHFLFPPFPPRETFFLIGLSTIALFFFGLGNYLVITSVVFLDPKIILPLIGVFVLAFVAGYLSIITPAGFGVREGVVLFALAKIIPSALAAFGALFSRVILIVSELIFILLSYLWHHTNNTFILSIEKLITKHPQVSIVGVLSFFYTIYFTTVSFLRYDNYYTGRFDLGNMAQTVWNTLHGNIFLFTNPNGVEQVSRLAFHADVILIFFAPFYAVWENPKMLLLIQTVVVAAGAFFVYAIARDVLKHRNLALVFAFAYLLNPSIQRANIYDFHAVTLVTTFFLAAYYFFLKKRYKYFILFALLAALCKEQIWLVVSLFGFLLFFWHKKWILGTGIFVFSIGMFYYLFWHAIPNALGAQHFALSYLSDFGDSPAQIIKSIFLSPDKIVEIILEPSRMKYITQLFSPLGYVSFLFPFFLIFAGPDLLINLLSSNVQLHQIYYQYTATITPFIFLSAIYGAYVLRKLPTKQLNISASFLTFALIIYILTASLKGAYLFSPLPGSKEPNLHMFTKQIQNRAIIDEYLAQIPQEASVAASNDLGSHLSHRKNIYVVPFGLDRADVVVLLITTDPQAEKALVAVRKDRHYKEVLHKDGFYAFERK